MRRLAAAAVLLLASGAWAEGGPSNRPALLALPWLAACRHALYLTAAGVRAWWQLWDATRRPRALKAGKSGTAKTSSRNGPLPDRRQPTSAIGAPGRGQGLIGWSLSRWTSASARPCWQSFRNLSSSLGIRPPPAVASSIPDLPTAPTALLGAHCQVAQTQAHLAWPCEARQLQVVPRQPLCCSQWPTRRGPRALAPARWTPPSWLRRTASLSRASSASG